MLLIGISLVLSFANYTPHTFLSGWDTLQPELNFPLAFSRIFSGVWRADQGLGAVAIQSHMADLPRVIYLWLASFILPLTALRYSYFFLMLAAGPLGIYFLASYLFRQSGGKFGRPSAFLAGLVYLMNLGTLQHFIVPLEMFATQFGLLPWIFWLAGRLLDQMARREILLFVLLVFFASSQAHTATLFYAFLLGFLFFLGASWQLNSQNRKAVVRRGVLLLFLILAVNSFWLLPNIYAVLNHGAEVHNSKVNQLFTPEALAKNQLFGRPSSAAVLKNFLFAWDLYDFQERGFVPVLALWQEHWQKPLVPATGYAIFALSLLGIFCAVRQKSKKILPFLPVYCLAFIFLLNGTPPVSFLFEKMGESFPILGEALRFPFTKFSILFMIGLSLFSGWGAEKIFSSLKKLPAARWAFLTLASGLLFIYFWPAFKGNLIHPAMRIAIPEEYFQAFAWFAGQENGRVAVLPIHSFWNWVYYDWGYQGAGFLQFGIKQPLLDRDYDRWSPYNEQYGREMAYAVYSQDPKLLRLVLEKYRIRWIFWDTAVISPGNKENENLNWLVPVLLKETGLVREEKKFGGSLTIFRVLGEEKTVYENLPAVGPAMRGAPEDLAFRIVGDYFTGTGQGIVDPYRAAFDQKERVVLTGLGFSQTASSPATFLLNPLFPCAEKIYGGRTIEGSLLRYTSENGPVCDHFAFPGLLHKEAYILEITSRRLQGFPLQIYLTNDLTGHDDLVVHLHSGNQFLTERFLLPPLADWGMGYTVNLNNFAIRGAKSVNEVSGIKIYPVDYQNLVNFLTAADKTEKKTVLVSGQAFEKGWKAYRQIFNFKFTIFNQQIDLNSFLAPITGREIKEHVLVNNWENGWVINKEQSKIYLIFWPQYLEYLGLGFLPITFFLVLFKAKNE